MSSLESLRRQAKRWLKALRAGDAEARTRLLRAHPGVSDPVGLRDVQHALARELGYGSWAELKGAAVAGAVPDRP